MTPDIDVYKTEIQHNKVESLIRVGPLRAFYSIDLMPDVRIDLNLNPVTLPARKYHHQLSEIEKRIRELKSAIADYVTVVMEDALDGNR